MAKQANVNNNRSTKSNKPSVKKGTLRVVTYHHPEFEEICQKADFIVDARIGGWSSDPTKCSSVFEEHFTGKYKLVKELGFYPGATPAVEYVSTAGDYIAGKIINALDKGVNVVVIGWNAIQLKAIAAMARLCTDAAIIRHWVCDNKFGVEAVHKHEPISENKLIELVNSFVAPKATMTGKRKLPKNLLGLF